VLISPTLTSALGIQQKCQSAQPARLIRHTSTLYTNQHIISDSNNVFVFILPGLILTDAHICIQQGCHSFVDPYVEHDTLTLLLDLILLKRGVYRHLLYNRGAKPRREITDSKTKSEAELANVTHTSYLSRARRIWTLKLGAGLIILDACMLYVISFQALYLNIFVVIRWTHLGSPSHCISLRRR
jgi:hypothetical protein